jgi:transposase, IS5 family
MGEEGAEKLFQGTLHVAHELGLLKSADCQRVIVDTTAQAKNIGFPTDAKLLFRMRAKLVGEARKEGIELRQSYERVGKHLLLKQSKYAHVKQFRRSKKAIRKLRTQLGRVIRDIERKCGNPGEKLKNLLLLGNRLYLQKREDRGKVYSLHEPAVECIAKGKAHKPYEFGCKVGLVISAKKNWILGAHALHGNPFDGHTLKTSIALTERNTGVRVQDAFVDRGYRGADHHPSPVRVFLSGRRRLPPGLKRLLRRRSAIEPVIGHVKHDHRMERNYLKGRLGDKINALLAAAAVQFAENSPEFLRNRSCDRSKSFPDLLFLHPFRLKNDFYRFDYLVDPEKV